MVDDSLKSYVVSVSQKYGGILGEIQKEALAEGIPVISHEVARLLSFVLSVKAPSRILEIGCATGFSAGLMASYLAPGGTLYTIDRYDYMIEKAKINFKRMNLENTVHLIEGDAADILPSLKESFDVIFLDAAKAQYIQFLPHCKRLLAPSGILIADDIFQGGSISKTKFSIPRRQRTIHKRMRHFIWEITHTDMFETTLIPIGDGVCLCHKITRASAVPYE